MLRDTTLTTPRADGIDSRAGVFFDGAVSARGEFDEGVEWDVEPGRFALVFLHEVSVDAAEDGLVGHDEDVF